MATMQNDRNLLYIPAPAIPIVPWFASMKPQSS
jgi:hypothetical protein